MIQVANKLDAVINDSSSYSYIMYGKDSDIAQRYNGLFAVIAPISVCGIMDKAEGVKYDETCVCLHLESKHRQGKDLCLVKICP